MNSQLPVSRGGKPSGRSVDSEAFEVFGLFRNDLRKCLSERISKLNRKTPTFKLASHRYQFEFNSEIKKDLND